MEGVEDGLKYRGLRRCIIVYQKYIGTSIKVCCATRCLYASSGPKAEGVPINNQKGQASEPCLKRLRQGPSYSPNSLVSQSATLKKCFVQGYKMAKTYGSLDDR